MRRPPPISLFIQHQCMLNELFDQSKSPFYQSELFALSHLCSRYASPSAMLGLERDGWARNVVYVVMLHSFTPNIAIASSLFFGLKTALGLNGWWSKTTPYTCNSFRIIGCFRCICFTCIIVLCFWWTSWLFEHNTYNIVSSFLVQRAVCALNTARNILAYSEEHLFVSCRFQFTLDFRGDRIYICGLRVSRLEKKIGAFRICWLNCIVLVSCFAWRRRRCCCFVCVVFLYCKFTVNQYMMYSDGFSKYFSLSARMLYIRTAERAPSIMHEYAKVDYMCMSKTTPKQPHRKS